MQLRRLTSITIVILVVTFVSCDHYSRCVCIITNTNMTTEYVVTSDTSFHADVKKEKGPLECNKYDGTKVYLVQSDSMKEEIDCSHTTNAP